MMKRILLCVLLGLPILVLANPECKRYVFLKNGFNIDAYERCHELIQQCPSKGALPDPSCAKRISKRNKICTQLYKLSTAIKGNPSSITAEQIGKFTLIVQTFIADGQYSYYIISPHGCLVNTKIDPRNFSSSLAKKYKNIPFIITNWDKPTFKSEENGMNTFTATLRITKTCLACDAVGWAKIQFIFNKNGLLKNINLVKFSREQK